MGGASALPSSTVELPDSLNQRGSHAGIALLRVRGATDISEGSSIPGGYLGARERRESGTESDMTDSRLQRWTPELRRAIMKVRPDYFAWSPAEQERYGVAIPQEDHERLSQALFRELWGCEIRSPKAAARAATRIPLDERTAGMKPFFRWSASAMTASF